MMCTSFRYFLSLLERHGNRRSSIQLTTKCHHTYCYQRCCLRNPNIVCAYKLRFPSCPILFRQTFGHARWTTARSALLFRVSSVALVAPERVVNCCFESASTLQCQSPRLQEFTYKTDFQCRSAHYGLECFAEENRRKPMICRRKREVRL